MHHFRSASCSKDIWPNLTKPKPHRRHHHQSLLLFCELIDHLMSLQLYGVLDSWMKTPNYMCIYGQWLWRLINLTSIHAWRAQILIHGFMIWFMHQRFIYDFDTWRIFYNPYIKDFNCSISLPGFYHSPISTKCYHPYQPSWMEWVAARHRGIEFKIYEHEKLNLT